MLGWTIAEIRNKPCFALRGDNEAELRERVGVEE